MGAEKNFLRRPRWPYNECISGSGGCFPSVSLYVLFFPQSNISMFTALSDAECSLLGANAGPPLPPSSANDTGHNIAQKSVLNLSQQYWGAQTSFDPGMTRK